MRVDIKILGMAKKYAAYPESSGNFLALDFSENSTVEEVLDKLDLPRDIPLLLILNEKESHLGQTLKEGDQLIICPPIYGG